MAESETSTARTVLICLFVMCGSLLFGVDSGEVGGFQAMTSFLQDYGYYDTSLEAWNITTPIQTGLNGILFAGCILACLSSGFLGSQFGRRAGLFAMGIVSIIGVIMQVTSTSVPVLFIGRFFAGCGIGFASNFVPVYQAEVAPTHLRGVLVGLYQTGINLGQVIGASVNYGTYARTDRWSYRIPLLTQIFFPVVIVLFTGFLPETPRWLISKGKTEKAAQSIRRLRGPDYSEEQINEDVREIAIHVEMEGEIQSSTSFLDCFRGSDRRRTFIACGTMFLQVFSGISFINAYGTYFYTVSGITNSFLITVISQICQFAGIIVMLPLVKFFGRRTILLYGAVAETICMFTFAIVGTVDASSTAAARCLVAFSCLYAFFFTATWAPVGWIVVSEISSNTMRSKTQALASASSWTGTLLLVIVLPYLINPTAANLGSKVGFIFGPLCMLGFLWVLFFVPETKNISLEQLDELFINNASLKEFQAASEGKNLSGIDGAKAEHVEKA